MAKSRSGARAEGMVKFLSWEVKVGHALRVLTTPQATGDRSLPAPPHASTCHAPEQPRLSPGNVELSLLHFKDFSKLDSNHLDRTSSCNSSQAHCVLLYGEWEIYSSTCWLLPTIAQARISSCEVTKSRDRIDLELVAALPRGTRSS